MFTKKVAEKKYDTGVSVHVPVSPEKMAVLQTLARMGLELARAVSQSTVVSIENCQFNNEKVGVKVDTKE